MINMVWIEYDMEYPRTIIWVDGELPLLYDPLSEKTEFKGWTERDMYMEHIVSRIKGEYCRNLKEEHIHDRCDHMCFRFMPKVYPNLLPKSFVDELQKGNEKMQNYRQLIFSLNEEACPKSKECIENVIHSIGFVIREKNDYENYEGFREYCESILDEISEIYVAPDLRTKRMMETLGFKTGF